MPGQHVELAVVRVHYITFLFPYKFWDKFLQEKKSYTANHADGIVNP